MKTMMIEIPADLNGMLPALQGVLQVVQAQGFHGAQVQVNVSSTSGGGAVSWGMGHGQRAL